MQTVLPDIILDICGLDFKGRDSIEILASDAIVLADKQAPYTVQMWRLQVFDDVSEP